MGDFAIEALERIRDAVEGAIERIGDCDMTMREVTELLSGIEIDIIEPVLLAAKDSGE